MPGTPLRPWNRINYVLIGSDVAPGWELQKSLAENNASYYIDVCVRIEHQRFDLIFIPPRERVFILLLMMYVPSGCRTSASVPGSRQERRIWDAAVNHAQPVGCWEGTFLELSFWFLLILPDYVWISAPAMQEGKPFYIVFGPSLVAAYDALRLAGKNHTGIIMLKLFQKSRKTQDLLG